MSGYQASLYKSVPFGVITKIVKLRAKENLTKAAAKAKQKSGRKRA